MIVRCFVFVDTYAGMSLGISVCALRHKNIYDRTVGPMSSATVRIGPMHSSIGRLRHPHICFFQLVELHRSSSTICALPVGSATRVLILATPGGDQPRAPVSGDKPHAPPVGIYRTRPMLLFIQAGITSHTGQRG